MLEKNYQVPTHIDIVISNVILFENTWCLEPWREV